MDKATGIPDAPHAHRGALAWLWAHHPPAGASLAHPKPPVVRVRGSSTMLIHGDAPAQGSLRDHQLYPMGGFLPVNTAGGVPGVALLGAGWD